MKFATSRALVALLSLGLFTNITRAADVTVTVHDAAGNKPLAGAKVTVGGGKSKQEFYTADDGSVKVPVANPRQLNLSATSDGYAPLSQYFYPRSPSEKMPEQFDFQLEHAITVSGTVVDQNNTPLAGAKVQCVINKKLANPNMRLGASWTTVTADAMGNWSVAGVPEAFDEIQIGAYHRDCMGAEPYYGMDPYKDIAALKNGTAILKLTRGTPLTITVTDENGAPIRNATIGYGEDRVASNVYPTEKTNAKGVCVLGIQAGITAPLTIQAKGFAPELQRVVIGQEPQALAIKLTAGQTLEGTVLDEKGDPANKATVYIDTWRGARTINKRLATDVDGHFIWTEAPADEVKADVLTAHGEKRGVVMKAGEENKVSLNPPTLFKGSVVDAATGQPITNYTVALGISFGPQQPLNWQYGNAEREIHHDGANFDTEFAYNYPGRAVRVIADGYLPSDSNIFPMDGKEVDFTFKMEKGQPIAGKIVAADGAPVHDVPVVLVTAGTNMQLQNGTIPEYASRNAIAGKSNADGTFSLPSQRDGYLVVVATDAGYAQADREAFQKNSTLTLQPWSRIEGVAMHGTKPAANVTVDGYTVQNYVARTQQEAQHMPPSIYNSTSATTDDQGKFVFDRVMPGDISIGIRVPMANRGWTTTNSVTVSAVAGKTVNAQVGGKGRSVTGRIVLPADIQAKPHTFNFANIGEDQETPTGFHLPQEFFLLPTDQRKAWLDKWQASDDGKKMMAEEQKVNQGRHMFNVPVNADGSFSVEGIPEGKYNFSAYISAVDNDNRNGGKMLAMANSKFAMPAIPGGVSDEPLDIGTIAATASTNGSIAARDDHQVKLVDGSTWKIEDHKNQYLLVYVFSPKVPASDAYTDKIKAVYDAVGKNDNFSILGLYFGADEATTKAYVADHHIPWPIGAMDEKDAQPALQELAGQDFPAAHLMGPDEQMVNHNIPANKLLTTVQSALAPKAAPKPKVKTATTIDPNDKLP